MVTASPALLMALHMYMPASSGITDIMSSVMKPKSRVSLMREPETSENTAEFTGEPCKLDWV